MRVSNHQRRLCFVIFLGASSITVLGQQVVDGPYVSYHGDQVIVTTIIKEEDLLKPVVKKHSFEQQANIVLDVVPEGEPKFAFQVKLQSSIANAPAVYPASGKLFLISDIEGEFKPFRELLLAAKVMNKDYQWTFGNGSLVIAGDLFDRGKDVIPELWLLYKLEDEAKAQGGKVHVILGNHDIMNLSGDHRYTDAKYFKSAWLLKTDCTGLFGADMELGRWLRSKNLMEKIGDLLILHGGVSSPINDLRMPLQQLNDRSRPFYSVANKRAQITDETLLPVFAGNTAPFWYRGFFMQPRASTSQVDSTLQLYACNRIIVGHTILAKNIGLYYNGKVLALDVNQHQGDNRAVLMEGNEWSIINAKGKKRKLVYDPSNDNLTDDDIK